MQEIFPLADDTNDIAFDINERGQVVGQSFTSSSARAFLYQDGVATDLNSLILPGSSLYLTLAQGINDRGEIVGTATDINTQASVAFLAVPVFDGSGNPEAASKMTGEDNSRKGILTEGLRKQLPGFSRLALASAGSK
jgi:probable HAF family extracellular repeat protein